MSRDNMDVAGKSDAEVAAIIRERCKHGDLEIAHSDADDILCELLVSLGYQQTVDEWDAVEKCYA